MDPQTIFPADFLSCNDFYFRSERSSREYVACLCRDVPAFSQILQLQTVIPIVTADIDEGLAPHAGNH